MFINLVKDTKLNIKWSNTDTEWLSYGIYKLIFKVFSITMLFYYLNLKKKNVCVCLFIFANIDLKTLH